jgi:hypothetical protein
MGDIFLKYLKVGIFCFICLAFTGVLAFGMYITGSLLITVQIMIGFITLPIALVMFYMTIVTVITQLKSKKK